MKSKKMFAAVVAFVLALSVGLTGCGKSQQAGNNSNDKIDKDQYLNLILPADVKTLDSSKATDSYSGQIIGEVMEGMTRITNDGQKDKVELAGAEKIDKSEDGLTWTFHLRDYSWSDGKKVTAEDFKYAWLRLLDPNTASDYAYFIFDIKNAAEYNAGNAKAEDVGIKVIDEKTLQVTLNNPVPYFDQIVAFKNLVPLRKDIVEAAGETYGQDPAKLVYNGPFVVEQWVKGSKVVLKKNEKYWDAKSVKLQTVNFQVVKEEASRMKMFETKQLDAVGARGEYLTKYKEQAQKGQIAYMTGYAPSSTYVFFNVNDKSKVFSSPKVRLAFSLALDREDYVKNVMKRYYAAYGWAPYALLNGDKEYRKEVPEPLKAAMEQYKDPKALFQEGLKDLGLDPNKQYEFLYLSSGTDTLTRTLDEWYQKQWETKLGVKIKIESTSDFPQFVDRVDRGEYQISAMGWAGDYNDPMTFFDMFTTGNGNNPGKWSNKDYDALVDKVRKEADFNKRLELFKQMEEILVVKDAGIAPVAYRDKHLFLQNYVKGFQAPLFGMDYEIKYAYTSGRQ
ncbi:peptide ABC transporter substrate-binding protein [Fonticella tunisiensis]|uniref:Oligopeptide transport system substrate-binding protein n=1 Tax=Fonticella tunisiensis TaxID=1096341 RepID=A0A4R7KQS7_9CLOT|nr:peptide ABC transporter substrate-binding protein [Fonticella tunisiensis]TDT61066.1 oligopeptide transport system substrate-binding protein [Fonticella tunisiensis]